MKAHKITKRVLFRVLFIVTGFVSIFFSTQFIGLKGASASIFENSYYVPSTWVLQEATDPKEFWFFVGYDTGWATARDFGSIDGDRSGYRNSGSLLASYYFNDLPWVADFGLGLQSNDLRGNISDVTAGYWRLGARYRRDGWQYGPTAEILMGNKVRFSGDGAFLSSLVGATVQREFVVEKHFPLRMGGSLMTDIDMVGVQVWALLLEIQVGMSAQPMTTFAKTEYVAPVVIEKELEPAVFISLDRKQISYNRGQVGVAQSDERFLRNLGRRLAADPELIGSVEVIGYTDTPEKTITNEILSRSRALAVKQMLATQGISANKITAKVEKIPTSQFVRQVKIRFRNVKDANELNSLVNGALTE